MATGLTLSPGARKIVQGLLMGAAAAVLALALWLPGWLEGFEARTWDLRARLLARPGPATSQVATILLDQKSLEWGKKVNGWGWPWPRQVYTAITDFCARSGARALVFDVFFTEPSVYGVSDDQAFAAGLAGNGRVVGAMNFGSDQATDKDWPSDDGRPPVAVRGLSDWTAAEMPKTVSFPLAEFPIPEVFKSAAMLSNAYLRADPVDRVYRRGQLFNTFARRVIPSEALAAYLVGTPGSHALSIAPGVLQVDGVRVPIDREGSAILRYRGPTTTHKAYAAAAIVQADIQLQDGQTKTPDLAVNPAELKDKYVFFGFSAPGLFDLKPSPMRGAYPGVEVHATMLDNLLSGDFMRTPSPAVTVLLLLVLCLGAGLAASASSRAGITAVIYVLFLAVAPALGIGAYSAGYWLQMVALELGVLFALVGSSLASYATEGQQKRYIKGAFKQYLSPTIIEELIAHPERLTLGGQKRDLSIFFSDLQGFTSISEVLTPEELTQLLNDYLTAMTDIIEEEGGTIDKYEGDAVIAFWNAPLDQADHAVRAVRAALRCQARLDELRPVFRQRVKKDLFKRIGINSGPAVVGNFGSKKKFNYTMLGDAVNLASRLEGVNKQFKTFTMISSMVKDRLGGAFPLRELSRIAVVGRKEPVTVFEPMTQPVFDARKTVLATFNEGLQAYYAGRFEEAARVFESISSQDPPATCYLEKCRKLQASPPQEGWNGVWVMTEK